MRKGFLQRLGRSHSRALNLLEYRRFFHFQTDVERDRHQDQRREERNAPAPFLEIGVSHRTLGTQNHSDGNKQAKSCRNLNEAGIEAAFVVRNVLRNVNGCAAVFTTQRQTLKNAQNN